MNDISLVSISNVVCQVGIAMPGAAAALTTTDDGVATAIAEWQKRRDVLLDELSDLPAVPPNGGWSRCSTSGNSASIATPPPSFCSKKERSPPRPCATGAANGPLPTFDLSMRMKPCIVFAASGSESGPPGTCNRLQQAGGPRVTERRPGFALL